MNWIQCLDRFAVFLDITYYTQCVIIPESGFPVLHFGHCPFLGADSIVVQLSEYL